MNDTLRPPLGVEAGSGPVSPVLMAVIGLVVVVVLIAATLCVVAILSVVLKASDQRADGLRVLQQLGQTLERIVGKLVDLFRRKRRDNDQDQDNDQRTGVG